MNLHNLFRHSGLVPKSSDSNDFLDTGLRQYDEYKVNGTALMLHTKEVKTEKLPPKSVGF